VTSLEDDDLRNAVHLACDTSRYYGGGTHLPETVPAEMVLRIAEKTYRRGVVQGASFLHWYLHHSHGRDETCGPYLDALHDWRERGCEDNWASGEPPPRSPLRVAPPRPAGENAVDPLVADAWRDAVALVEYGAMAADDCDPGAADAIRQNMSYPLVADVLILMIRDLIEMIPGQTAAGWAAASRDAVARAERRGGHAPPA
jgi:hypothetical protein